MIPQSGRNPKFHQDQLAL
jgi:photosystem II stability/assembly factor-like uncharacterized protein